MRSVTDRQASYPVGPRLRPRSAIVRSSAVWTASSLIVILLICPACSGLERALRRGAYDYDWERRKCNTLIDTAEKETCLGDLRTAEEKAINPSGYITAQADARREAANEKERQAVLSRCDTAADAARRAIANGKYREGLKISKDSYICPNALAIESAFVRELRKRSASEIARYGDEAVLRAYWQPMDFGDWAFYASKGKFITDQAVWIVGTVEQQVDNMIIVNIMGSGTRCALRFDRSRYFMQGGGIEVLGRFVKMEQFANAFGVRRDLPVFEFAY